MPSEQAQHFFFMGSFHRTSSIWQRTCLRFTASSGRASICVVFTLSPRPPPHVDRITWTTATIQTHTHTYYRKFWPRKPSFPLAKQQATEHKRPTRRFHRALPHHSACAATARAQHSRSRQFPKFHQVCHNAVQQRPRTGSPLSSVENTCSVYF